MVDFSKIRDQAFKASQEGMLGSYAFTPNKFALFRKKDDEEVIYAYKCEKCGFEEEKKEVLEWPYKIKCASCKKVVFESKKGPGVRKKKKKDN